MRSVGNAARDQAQRERLGPIAIVADNGAAYASAMVYVDAARGIDRPIRIFREQHEARPWLDSLVPAESVAKG